MELSLIDHEIILVVIVCAALWTQKFKEITSKIHMTPMRGGSIDLFDPKLEGLRQEPVRHHQPRNCLRPEIHGPPSLLFKKNPWSVSGPAQLFGPWIPALDCLELSKE